jgi:hypothetical protein
MRWAGDAFPPVGREPYPFPHASETDFTVITGAHAPHDHGKSGRRGRYGAYKRLNIPDKPDVPYYFRLGVHDGPGGVDVALGEGPSQVVGGSTLREAAFHIKRF